MGDPEDREAALIQILQPVHDLAPVIRVEVADGVIGSHLGA